MDESSVDGIVRTGIHKPYHWLTATDAVYTGTILRLCPETVFSRYLATTSFDSGIYRLSEKDIAAGWQLRGDVAYSPLLESFDHLYYQRDGLDSPGYDEWYVSEKPLDLGPRFQGPFFEFDPAGGEVLVFVNLPAFVLHEPDIPGIQPVFWRQLLRIAPESYIGDGRDCLTLVSKREELIRTVHEALLARSLQSLPDPTIKLN